MDNETLQSLIQLGAMKHGEIAKTFVPTALIPSESRVIDLEQYLKQPLRRRLSFSTTRIEAFGDYTKEMLQADCTVVFIDPEDASAKAVIDFGTPSDPGWRQHKATLSLPLTPEAQAIQKLCQHPVSQRDMINFIEDFGSVLSALTSEDEDLLLKSAVTAIRSITIDKVREVTSEEADFEQSRSTLDRISASSKKMIMPAQLRASFVPREGLDPVQVSLRLSVRSSGDAPMFTVRMVSASEYDRAITKDVEEKVRAAVGDGITIYIGDID